jgi:hypothetical protein
MSVDCELRIDKAFRKVLRLILVHEYDLANPGTPAESPMKTQFINDNCKAFRTRSVSSIRSVNDPPFFLANNQLINAVRTFPTCNNPVGDGANLVLIFISL